MTKWWNNRNENHKKKLHNCTDVDILLGGKLASVGDNFIPGFCNTMQFRDLILPVRPVRSRFLYGQEYIRLVYPNVLVGFEHVDSGSIKDGYSMNDFT